METNRLENSLVQERDDVSGKTQVFFIPSCFSGRKEKKPYILTDDMLSIEATRSKP